MGSYDMTAFEKKVYEVIKSIPRGKVMTYKQVAICLGNPNLSRAVGNALHKNPDGDSIPCHRVVNARGGLAVEFAFGGREGQKEKLENEGIEVKDYKVDSSFVIAHRLS